MAQFDIKEGMLLPEKVNNVKKGTVVMLAGCPCKVVEMKKSKPGKHGSAKTLVVGLDIFTGKKHDEILRDEAQVVVNDKIELLLLNVDGDALSLMTDTGETRGDLNLPPGDLGEEIRDKFDEGMQLNLTILRALGREQIMGWYEDKA